MSKWTNAMMAEIATVLGESPALSNAEIAELLTKRTGVKVSKDAVQKARARKAQEINAATEQIVQQGRVRSISVSREEVGPDGMPRKVSVSYAMPKHLVTPAEPRRIDYLQSTAKLAPRNGNERLVVALGDTQFPFEEPAAWALTLLWLRDVKPAEVILTGDIIDAYSVSKFEKDPRLSYGEEIQHTHDRLAELRAAVGPEAKVTFVPGNHELRHTRYVRNEAPQLVGLRDHATGRELLSLPHLLGLDIIGIDWVGPEANAMGDEYLNGVYRITDDLVATHGFHAKKGGGGASLLPLVDAWQVSVVGGHDHRQGIGQRTVGGVIGAAPTKLRAISTGMLCRRNLGYLPADTSDWQWGFAVISMTSDGWHPEIVEIDPHAGRLTWRGWTWRVDPANTSKEVK